MPVRDDGFLAIAGHHCDFAHVDRAGDCRTAGRATTPPPTRSIKVFGNGRRECGFSAPPPRCRREGLPPSDGPPRRETGPQSDLEFFIALESGAKNFARNGATTSSTLTMLLFLVNAQASGRRLHR
jgi:hypothetical protein